MKKVIDVVLFAVCMAVCMPVMANASPMAHVLGIVLVLLALCMPKVHKPWYLDMNGGVDISFTNGALGGTTQTNDGIMGMVLTGNTGDAYTLGTPILVTSLPALGTGANAITLANNPFAYRQVSDFFTNAGTGAQLYLLLVPDTMTVAQMADVTNANGALKLWNYANGAIKGIGVMSDDQDVTVTTVTGINVDCYTAITKLQAFCVAAVAAKKPCFGIVGGTSYSGVPGDLTNESSGTADNFVGCLIGDIEPPTGYSDGTGAALGYLMGVIATLPVQRKTSRVLNGALTGVDEAYVGTETIEAAGGDMITIADKGYMSFVNYPNESGYFFGNSVAGLPGDRLCTITSDDYATLSNRRVINKAFVLCYAFGVQLIDDDKPVATGGVIDPGYASWLQNQFVKQINNNMTAAGECSACTAFVDPTQNIVETGVVTVAVGITPVGYSTEIVIPLGFSL